ncbi:hypothetical protein KS4_11750 [Poriferisphaera corsica]|uniref:Dockerin domain-containing protein n=1 Tax=Poriferisphaera corsica TaxID=2528020 RepID=A0A517YSL0_9BACT|nr:dockerin type I domain-containing protein [Poriferisphaera corsica]QDU33132.1 hypothetical protein KS4_11750 [Poriferisphaera corsica]
MTIRNRYRTATLLSAFCTLTFVSPSFAGFTENDNGVYLFQKEGGAERLFIDLGTEDNPTINFDASIDGPGYNNAHDVVLYPNLDGNGNEDDGSWLAIESGTATINYASRINLTDISGSLKAFSNPNQSFNHDDNLTFTFADNSLLNIFSTGTSHGIYTRGTATLKNMAGDLTVIADQAYGISAARAQYDNFTGNITVEGTKAIGMNGRIVLGEAVEYDDGYPVGPYAGEFNGSITAKGRDATGIWGSVISNIDFDANIFALSDNDDGMALGIRSTYLAFNENLGGKIIAKRLVKGYNNFEHGAIGIAYGLYYSPYKFHVKGDVSSYIEATSFSGNAIGIYSTDNVRIDGDVTGTIKAEIYNGNNSAYGIYSQSINIGGDISGDIIANARYIEDEYNDRNTIALYANDSFGIQIGGGISGNISVQQKNYDKDNNGTKTYAMYTENGGIKIGGNGITGAINVISNNSETAAIKADNYIHDDDTVNNDNSIQIAQINSQINVISGIDSSYNANAYGMKAEQGTIQIGSIGEDAQINVIGRGVNPDYNDEPEYEKPYIYGNHVYGLITGEPDDSSGSPDQNIVITDTFAGQINVTGTRNIAAIKSANNIDINNFAEPASINVTTEFADYGSSQLGIYGLVAAHQINIDQFSGDINIQGRFTPIDEVPNLDFIRPHGTAVQAMSDINIGSFNESATIGGDLHTGILSHGKLTITNDFAGKVFVGVTQDENGNELIMQPFYARGIAGYQGTAFNTFTDSAIIKVSGDQYAWGISGGIGLTITDGMHGTIDVTANNRAYGVMARTINANNITGTIKASSIDQNGQSAAITTQFINGNGDWESQFDGNDFVNLNTGANIIGDIRLAGENLVENTYGDILKLTGAGSFNHDLYGVDSLFVVADTPDQTWQLNLASEALTDDTQRNHVDRAIVHKGFLHINENFSADYLSLTGNAGLTLNVTEPTTEYILTLSEGASLNGTLRLNLDEDFSANEGDIVSLIWTTDPFTGSGFTSVENTIINESLGFNIHQEGAAVLGKVALLGDANLDGLVDASDLNIIAVNFNKSPQSFNQQWNTGDFNGDNIVDALDLNVIAINFGKTADELLELITIPEPTSLFLLSSLLIPLSRRRRTA